MNPDLSREQPARRCPRIPSNSVLPAITDLASLISFRRRALRMTWWYTGRTRLGGPDLQGLPNRPARATAGLREPSPLGAPPRPDSPANFQERLSQALIASGERVLLLGGVACNVHGSSRHTYDVDYWLDPAPEPSAWATKLLGVARAAEDAVEVSRIQGPRLGKLPAESLKPLLAFAAEAAVADGVVRLSCGDYVVDVFYDAHNLPDFEAAWKRSLPLAGPLRVLGREDLIASKRGTGRKQDEDDIRFLESLP
ncbi:MAG: hypothetical protein IT578_07600 [Verrucomicrobiae bacterium]|nr:hypothetical protein [Verrucomicrobiae bacterium]